MTSEVWLTKLTGLCGVVLHRSLVYTLVLKLLCFQVSMNIFEVRSKGQKQTQDQLL